MISYFAKVNNIDHLTGVHFTEITHNRWLHEFRYDTIFRYNTTFISFLTLVIIYRYFSATSSDLFALRKRV